MYFVIGSTDGEIRYRSTAETLDEAIEQMAEHFGYDTYNAMCIDLGYTGRSFKVARVVEDENQAEVIDSRPERLKRVASSVLGAFKTTNRARSQAM